MPGTAGQLAWLARPILCQALLTEPFFGECGGRKGNRRWLSHREPCLNHASCAPTRAIVANEINIQVSSGPQPVHPRAARPHHALAAWWGCGFAALCQYVTQSWSLALGKSRS